MSVTVNEPRQHRHLGQIDDGDTIRYLNVGATRFDFGAVHQNYLIRECLSGLHINQFSRANGRNTRRCRLDWLR